MHAALTLILLAGFVLALLAAAAPAAHAWPTAAPGSSMTFHCHKVTGGWLWGVFSADRWKCYPGPAHADPSNVYH